MLDARSLSQINPTAGPAVPPKKALKPPHKALAIASSAAEQRREIAALNDLAAAGYGQFHDVHRVGRNYQATIDDPHGSYSVTIDPDNGRVTPPSAAADRETRALNFLVDRGYVQVSPIRPSGIGFVANVTQDGGPQEVAVDREPAGLRAATDSHAPRTGTSIRPIRSNSSVITSPGTTRATPSQVPVMMMSPGSSV
jgi:hypothetical protein